MLDFFIFLISLLILIKSSDILVTSASSLAKSIGVSDFIIGLTVVAIGTSVPELAASVSSSLIKNSDLIIGNLLGSNITNIGLILGFSAILSTIKINKLALYRDGIFMLVSAVLFFLFALDKKITPYEGIVLILLFVLYVYDLIKNKPKHVFGYEHYIETFWSLINPSTYTRILDKAMSFKKPVFTNLIYLIFSIILIAASSRFLVDSVSRIAINLGIHQTIMGFFLLALGTTIPELIVSITSIYRKLNNILIGNLIGSNITNLMLIAGVSSVISPLAINKLALFYLIPFMIFLTLIFLILIRTTFIFKKLEGFVCIVLYLAFSLFLLIFVI